MVGIPNPALHHSASTGFLETVQQFRRVLVSKGALFEDTVNQASGENKGIQTNRFQCQSVFRLS